REIQESRIGAGWVSGVDRALVKINRACVKIRGIARTSLEAVGAIRNRQQFQIVESLLHAAAIRISTIENAAIIDLCPCSSTIQALPNALIHWIAARVRRNEPYIHFISSGHHSNLAAIDRTGSDVALRTSRSTQQSRDAGLIRQSRPGQSVRRRVEAVVAQGREKQSCRGVIYHRRGRCCFAGPSGEKSIVGPGLPRVDGSVEAVVRVAGKRTRH